MLVYKEVPFEKKCISFLTFLYKSNKYVDFFKKLFYNVG